MQPELTCFLRSHCCSRGQEDRMAPFSDADCEQHTSHVTFSECCTTNDTHTRGSSRQFGVRISHSMRHLHALMLCV